jgi:hypothetical protein
MLAITAFQGRVAPVLNWCSKILIISRDVTEGGPGRELILSEMSGFERLRVLREKGVGTLICGASSPELLNYGEDLGLHIIHGVAGEIHEVVQAYFEQRLDQPRFRLPGCAGRRRYRSGKAGFEPGSCSSTHKENRTKPVRGKGSCGEFESIRKRKLDNFILKGSILLQNVGKELGGSCVCPHCGTRVLLESGTCCGEILCPGCRRFLDRG